MAPIPAFPKKREGASGLLNMRISMSIYKVLSDREYALPNLVNMLLITWACSLLWGGGLFFSGWAFYVAMWGGWLSSFGSPVWETPIAIALILGLVATFSSPILLRATITRNWQQSIKAGLGSFLAGILTFLAVWIGAGVFYQWTSNYIYFFCSLIISLTACSTIVTLTLLTKSHRYRTLELIAGVIIGIGISMVSGMTLGTGLLTDDNIFHLIWQIPPLVWISTIYLPELLAGRSRTIDFLVWAFLTLISFGLPFIVTPLFPLK